jgi:hypothetical protein
MLLIATPLETRAESRRKVFYRIPRSGVVSISLHSLMEEAMPRAIVYPPRARDGEIVAGRRTPNDYADKLAKYVPAEVLSGFLLLVAMAEQSKDPQQLLITCFIAGLVMTPIYLAIAGLKSAPRQQKQRWYSYILSIIAFVGWAVGTRSSMARLLYLEPEIGSFILAVIVFAVPGIDQLLTHLYSGRRTDV